MSLEITLEVIGAILTAAIAVLQFFQNALQYPVTRWIVAAAATVAVACFGVARIIGERKRKQERVAWESGQVERDQQLVAAFVAQIKRDDVAVVAAAPSIVPVKDEDVGMTATDPRIFASIKEPTEAIFSRTPFVLRNEGGDIAHKVRIEMLFKLNGRNVSFEPIETIPKGESRESLPEIEDGSLQDKHDIFRWLMADWNGNSRGIAEEWPKQMTIKYQDFSGKQFETMMTLVFHPIKHMLKTSKNWPGTAAAGYVTWEFRDISFRRVK